MRVIGGDRARLRLVLASLFLALAAATAVLSWQAWDRLKWQAWYQQRVLAEQLTERIDDRLNRLMTVAASRNFNDYAFSSTTPGGKLVQRSPLSMLPVSGDIPGIIGYFQIDPGGRFSTPLLPPGDANAGEFGLSDAQLSERNAIASRIRKILAENRLVPERRDMPVAAFSPTPRPQSPAEEAGASGRAESDRDLAAGALSPVADSPEPAAALPEAYAQQAFDQLRQSVTPTSADIGSDEPALIAGSREEVTIQRLGRIRDLKLDDALEKKNAAIDRESAILPEVAAEERAAAPARRAVASNAVPKAEALQESTITTFRREADPFQLNLLASGELVMYRNVWHDDQRYIQGLLVDRTAFVRDAIESAYQTTPLSQLADMVVGYRDEVIRMLRAEGESRYPADSGELRGSLLYRGRLSAPFDGLELIFAVNRLPPGPGATVLAWTVALVGFVLVGGFLALYRLGLGQIRLARQQQDFVSSVSHELKTPLTSIRMYGEMLREGWVDDAKRNQYYEYIHEESERLARLISNVLQLARITRSDPQFELAETTLGRLCDLLTSKLSAQAERAGFELAIDCDTCADKTVTVDEDCFLQIFINLVDNAIKFSRKAEARRIDIGCRELRDGSVEMRVRDYGPGIPRAQLRKVFELFYRPESELTRETAGTGIGLAIVRRLTTGMGGKVDVVNRGPGAEFRITLPAR